MHLLQNGQRMDSFQVIRPQFEMRVFRQLLEFVIVIKTRPDLDHILASRRSREEVPLRHRQVAPHTVIRIEWALSAHQRLLSQLICPQIQNSRTERLQDGTTAYLISQSDHDPMRLCRVGHARVPESQVTEHNISTRARRLDRWPDRSARVFGFLGDRG
jgi:hypothetical protein